MRAIGFAALLLAASALLSGCKQIGFQPRRLRMEHKSVRTASGLEFEEIFLGSGRAAQLGDPVTFEYTVWLEGGQRVDSTFDRGVAITVELGKAPLPAWNEGLIGIQPQGRRRLIVPPHLAYGEKGVEGMIPPNATLVIEVLALEVGRKAPPAPP